jgi:hypothetical protein
MVDLRLLDDVDYFVVMACYYFQLLIVLPLRA